MLDVSWLDRRSCDIILARAKLAGKCNEGRLTPEERREYEMYLMANHFVAILKAEARILLDRKSRPA